jgi:hypothetical protein
LIASLLAPYYLLGLGGAKPTPLVKVTVSERAFGRDLLSHTVKVKNLTQDRTVVLVEIGRSPGLPDPPLKIVAPKGWDVKLFHTDRTGEQRGRGHLRFACEPPSSADCIGPGETRSFVVDMRYRSASLYGPLLAVFASGERVVAKP